MKKLFLVIVFLTGIISAQNNPEITSTEIQDHINYLASDELEGRMTGTPELYKAAEFLKNEFESYGLKPLFNGSYFQEFPFMEKLELGDKNEFVTEFVNVNSPGGRYSKLEQEFIPLSFTDNQSIECKVVFAGYGISARELEYDDYAGIDVKDKIVVVFRNHPDMKSPHSKFEQYSSLRYKTTNARDKGAKGIIFVNTSDKTEDPLIELRYDNAAKITGISAVQVKRSALGFISLSDLQNQIDSTLKPKSFIVEENHLTIGLSTEANEVKGTSVNVGAYLDAGNEKFSKGLHPHLYKIFSLVTIEGELLSTTTRSAK